MQQLLWAGIGLALTIGGTFTHASITTAPWLWLDHGLQFQPLNVTYQLGMVLLIGCLGGPWGATSAQLLYVALGLVGLQIFTHGGGVDYLQEPTFGYLAGFIPGAWLCARLAFRQAPTLESLMLSCLAGFSMIHLLGITYQVGLQLVQSLSLETTELGKNIFQYSIQHLPSQLAMTCAVALVAFVVRRLLFY
ncbi:MAG: biotin transporter BioY [Spirulina sp. SIO3F2]|nr:biotin transporter BioY [Spirulina sp. SIO3F2]